MARERLVIRIAPNNPVFDLSALVGIEEKPFAKAGLDVQMSAGHDDREKDSADIDVFARFNEQTSECGSAGSGNVRECASTDRLERGPRGRGGTSDPEFRREPSGAARALESLRAL